MYISSSIFIGIYICIFFFYMLILIFVCLYVIIYTYVYIGDMVDRFFIIVIVLFCFVWDLIFSVNIYVFKGSFEVDLRNI